METLPTSWALVEIEKLLLPLENKNVLQQGWSPQCENESVISEDEWGVLKTTAIQQGQFLPEHNKRLPSALEPRPQIEVVPGDILMTCAGPRNRCGIVCLVKKTRKRLMMSGKMYRFRGNPVVLTSSYLGAFLQSRAAKLAIDKMKTGINDSGLNLTHDRFKKLLVPVAPPLEQHRIVAKIEELFSELDKGVENLKTAQAQLKVYRQALLKHAFEGKLTAQWRADNPDKLETAEALLKRIQGERAQRYQQQLAEWEAGGKQGSKPKAPKLLAPPATNELSDLPELPDGWVYSRLGMLIDEPTYGTSKKCDYENQGIGVLRIPNVVSGKIDASDLKFANFDDDELATYRLADGDLLIIRSNGSVSIVGRCALVSSADVSYLYAGYLIKLRPNQQIVKPAYLLSAFSTHEVRKQVEHKAKSTSGVNNINTGEIQSIVVAVCSAEEQQQAQMAIDAKLSEIDQLEQTLAVSLQQSEALRQSILKKAFSGQLVPQDPHDEPASTLLARIKAEKSASPQSKKARQ